MNPFLLRSREMLTAWKAFRKSLPLMPEDQQLLEVARYWGLAPTFKHSYDVQQPVEWTSPWEMIVANRWCRFSTAIGMEFTLRLAGWDPRRLALKLIVDYDIGDTFFVLEVDGVHWLNHEHRKVIPPSDDYDVLCGWSFSGSCYVPVAICQDAAAA